MAAIEDDYSFISSIDVMSLTSEQELTFSELMRKAHKPLSLYQENQYSKRKLKVMANRWIDDLLKGEFATDFDHRMRTQEAKKQWYSAKD